MNPGSLEAFCAGCLCPQVENGYGFGVTWLEPGRFIVSGNCPLHRPTVNPCPESADKGSVALG